MTWSSGRGEVWRTRGNVRDTGQVHLQTGRAGRGAVDGQATAVQFNDALDDGQAESRAAVFAGAGFLAAEKLVENPHLVRGGDAGPVLVMVTRTRVASWKVRQVTDPPGTL